MYITTGTAKLNRFSRLRPAWRHSPLSRQSRKKAMKNMAPPMRALTVCTSMAQPDRNMTTGCSEGRLTAAQAGSRRKGQRSA